MELNREEGSGHELDDTIKASGFGPFVVSSSSDSTDILNFNYQVAYYYYYTLKYI